MRLSWLMKICGLFTLCMAGQGFAANKSIYGEGIADLDPYYVPHIEFGGYYFTDTPHKAGVLRGFLPIGIDDPNHLLYIDARSIVKNGGVVKEGNLGLGFRKLNTDNTKLYGCYAFYDRKRTSTSVLFSQVTLGLEHWRQRFFIGANLYLPVGKHSATESINSSTAGLNQTSPGVYNILVTNTNSTSTEVALMGADLDIGYQFTENLVGYLGLYRFVSSTSSVKVNPVQGPLANLQYIFYPESKLFFGTFDRITLENQLQYDSTRGTRWYAGIRFSIALGDHYPTTMMQRHMVDPAFRDIDLVAAGTQTSSTTVEVATNENGTPIKVQTATSTAQVNALIGDSTVQVIAVQGVINDVNPSNVALATGQAISGGNYTLEYKGIQYQVPVSSGATLRSVSGASTLLKAGKNNSIENITLTMVGVVPTGSNNAISADTTVNDLGVLLINGVTSNGTLNIVRNGASQTGEVQFYNSNFTSSAAWLPTTIPPLVQFFSRNNAQLKVDVQNNTIVNSGTTEVIGLDFRVDNNGNLNIYSVQNNYIYGTDSGINYVSTTGGGSIIQSGALANNYVSSGSASRPGETGILFFRFGSNVNTIRIEGPVTNNTIDSAGDAFTVTNFSGSSNLSSTISFLGGIYNNKIYAAKYSTSADGFNIGSLNNVTILIQGMKNNNIFRYGATGAGIRVRNTGTTINVGNGNSGLSASNGNTPVVTLLSPTINPGP